MAEIGRDFVERHENEGAAGKAWVRDFKPRLAENHIAIEQDVEIERAWAVGRAGRAITAEFDLDREKAVQQFLWRKMRLHRDHGVREAGLICESDGRGGIKRRARGDAAKGGQAFGSGDEGGLRRAGRAEKVGAECDVGEGHPDNRLTESAGLAELAGLAEAMGWVG